MNRFYALGEQAVPAIDEVRQGIRNHDNRKALDDLLLNLVFPDIQEEFYSLSKKGLKTYQDLESALILTTRIGNPTLRSSVITNQFDHLAKQISDDVNYAIDTIESMHILLNFVYADLGFKACEDDYHKPEYSYLDRLLITKKGIPISLAIVVLLIAKRLELPISGINMPMHFLLMYEQESEVIMIDPYQKGMLLSHNQVMTFLKMNGIDPKDSFFAKSTYLDIALRYVRNLLYSYQKMEDKLRVNMASQLIQFLEVTPQ